jgi:hypothetical protein
MAIAEAGPDLGKFGGRRSPGIVVHDLMVARHIPAGRRWKTVVPRGRRQTIPRQLEKET